MSRNKPNIIADGGVSGSNLSWSIWGENRRSMGKAGFAYFESEGVVNPIYVFTIENTSGEYSGYKAVILTDFLGYDKLKTIDEIGEKNGIICGIMIRKLGDDLYTEDVNDMIKLGFDGYISSNPSGSLGIGFGAINVVHE